jgi:uncharacterized protein YndB with AHSA1/START domain
MSVTHSTFTLEREYAVTPARLFAAFSTKEQREKWFGDPSQPPATWDFDFREGGREYTSGEFHGQLSVFDATFHDIVDNERIVFGYNLYVGGAKLSSSLQTLEFFASSAGTRLLLTEYGAYFDGNDSPALREAGTRGLLEQLAAVVENHAAESSS